MSSESPLQLNIGCGPSGQLPGFVNIDNSRSVLVHRWPWLVNLLFRLGILNQAQKEADWQGVKRMDASRRLPYADNSVDKIYSSHFLEHIPEDRARLVLAECFRCLKPGGVLRLVVPDLLWYSRQYVDATEQLLASEPESVDASRHDDFLRSVYGAFLSGARYGLHHVYMYDAPSLRLRLHNVGFVEIQQQEFRQGRDMDLAVHDCRPDDSLHFEAYKPT